MNKLSTIFIDQRSTIYSEITGKRKYNIILNYCYLLKISFYNTFNVKLVPITMALDYISSRISRDEFYEKIYAKSRSKVSVETAKAHLNNLDYFCQDKYNRETNTILDDLREDME